MWWPEKVPDAGRLLTALMTRARGDGSLIGVAFALSAGDVSTPTCTTVTFIPFITIGLVVILICHHAPPLPEDDDSSYEKPYEMRH
jgi:hypothetical protein